LNNGGGTNRSESLIRRRIDGSSFWSWSGSLAHCRWRKAIYTQQKLVNADKKTLRLGGEKACSMRRMVREGGTYDRIIHICGKRKATGGKE